MSSLRIIAIVQARMASSRLPGKVLKDIAGKPMLLHVVERLRMARTPSTVVVATTTDPSDDAVEELCGQHHIACYRGSLYDVLDRFYQAAKTYKADVVIRITADCPLLDPGLVDETVQALFDSGADFCANRLPPPWKRTYPIGLDCEVVSFEALERAWREASVPYQREHVLPYLYDEEGRFKVHVINHVPDYGHLRWTVDTAEDLEVVRKIFAHFSPRQDFTWKDVLEYYLERPDLQAANANVHHKSALDLDEKFSREEPQSSSKTNIP